MVFEYILRQNGIEPGSDVTIDQSIDFGSTAAAFSGGQGDFTVEFEPSATLLESENKGHVVASLGTDSGYVPYTAFSAKKSYIDNNPEVIQSFTNALQKGMDYVQTHSPEEIAKIIEPQFNETELDTITTIVTRYYDQDTWKENLVFEEESFELLQIFWKTPTNFQNARLTKTCYHRVCKGSCQINHTLKKGDSTHQNCPLIKVLLFIENTQRLKRQLQCKALPQQLQDCS